MVLSNDHDDDMAGTRKSERGRREKRSYSPTLTSNKGRKKKRKLRHGGVGANQLPAQPYDKGPDGNFFNAKYIHVL